MKYTAHDKKCYACNRARKKHLLGYDPSTLKTYCIHREECFNSSAIPNVELHELTTESFNDMIMETYGEEIFGALDKMLGKSVSLRLKPALAMHLLKIMQENDLFSINEALLYVLNRDLEQKEINVPLEEVNIEVYTPRPLVPYIPEPEPEPVVIEPEPEVVEVVKFVETPSISEELIKELAELKKYREELEEERRKLEAEAMIQSEPEPEPEPIEEPKEEVKEPEEDDEWEI